MRLIYGLLAIRMIRLARLDLARSDLLYRDGDAAFARSRDRVRQAEALERFRFGLNRMAGVHAGLLG